MTRRQMADVWFYSEVYLYPALAPRFVSKSDRSDLKRSNEGFEVIQEV